MPAGAGLPPPGCARDRSAPCARGSDGPRRGRSATSEPARGRCPGPPPSGPRSSPSMRLPSGGTRRDPGCDPCAAPFLPLARYTVGIALLRRPCGDARLPVAADLRPRRSNIVEVPRPATRLVDHPEQLDPVSIGIEDEGEARVRAGFAPERVLQHRDVRAPQPLELRIEIAHLDGEVRVA